MFNTASNTDCRTLEVAKSLKPLPILFNPMIPIVLFFEGVIPNIVHQVAQNLLYRNLNSHNKGQGGTGYIYILKKHQLSHNLTLVLIMLLVSNALCVLGDGLNLRLRSRDVGEPRKDHRE